MSEIRVLIIEDSVRDAELLILELSRGGMVAASERVETPEELAAALKRDDWDIIFSDHNLPGFSSLEALELFKQMKKDIPFIIISGTIGEDVAVEAMKAGANDYLIKGKLARLIPAVQRELREAKDRQLRRQAEALLEESEKRFQNMADTAPVLIWMSAPEGPMIYVNKLWREFTGSVLEQNLGWGWQEVIHSDDWESLSTLHRDGLCERKTYKTQVRVRRFDGIFRWMLMTGSPRYDGNNNFCGFVGSCTDVTELKEAKEAAEEANQNKNRFLGRMSHELKTPLNAIMGYSEMLLNDMVSRPEKQKMFLQHIATSSHHLSALINDILDVTKIETGKIALIKRDINLTEFIEEIEGIFYKLLQEKNISLSFDIVPDLTHFVADQSRLKQIFVNLIHNAIKFNRPDGFVKVKLFLSDNQEQQWLTCEVEDSGIGMPKDKLEQLFTEFYSVSMILPLGLMKAWALA